MVTIERAQGSSSYRAAQLLRLVGFGLLIFLMCWAVVALSREMGKPAPIWPANAITLMVLLHTRPREWSPWLVVAWLANTLAGLMLGRPALLAFAASGCNVVGVLAAATLLWRTGRGRPNLSRISDFARFFLIAGVASPLLTAALAAQVVGLLKAADPGRVFTVWTAADALGNLIVVPVLFSLKGIRKRLAARPIKATGWLSLALLAAVTLAVFSVRQPLAFLIPPALMLVVFQLELLGAAWGTSVVVAIAITMTYAGLGPMASVHGAVTDRLIVAQLFLASLTLSSFPMAAILAQRRRLRARANATAARVESQLSRLRQAEEIAGVGYWRLEAATGAITWSDAMYDAFGMERGGSPDLAAAMARIHPDDREQADHEVARALEYGESYAGQTRLVWPNGEFRHVLGKAACERDACGKVVAVVGTMLDVTELKRAETKVAESEARYRILADVATDVVVKVDGQGAIRYVSPAIRRYGFDPEALVGVSGFDMVHPDDVGKLRDIMTDLFTTGVVDPARDRTYRLRTADGRNDAWMEGNPALVRGADGEVMAVVTQLRDISERRLVDAALAESEARYRLLADSATDVISRTAMSGEVLYLSPAIERFTGYSADEMLGRNILDFVHPDDLVAFRACSKALVKSERPNGVPFAYRLRHKDGHSTWVESNPTLLRDEAGRPVAMVDVSRDVTAHRALEAELREARDAAEAAAAVKGEFLANMSHELRTPLTSVLGFTRLALEQPELSEASRNFIGKASNAGAALLSTVNDILDFSKLESGQLQIRAEPFDPAPICRDTLELFGQAAADKGVMLRFEEAGLPPALSSDPNRLRQILLNLIGNAVKFTEAGAVTLTVEYRDADQRLHVSVKDDGPGISTEDQALLFRRFSQVDGSSTRRHGGTGLGLAICLGLVEAMGGEIGVESEPGKGARFYFDVVAPTVEAPNDAASLDGEMFAPGTRVLVADDHPVNREFVRLVLAPFGAEVTEAANGVEAVAWAERRPFDIILMDLRMPELDGMDAMKAIREGNGPNADVPILAFSAGSDAPTAQLRREAGFDGDLAKPVLPEGLIAAVAQFTGGWEQADDLAASAA